VEEKLDLVRENNRDSLGINWLADFLDVG